MFLAFDHQEFLSLIIKRFDELFDFFKLETILFYFSSVLFVLLLEWMLIGWNKSSFKRILSFNGSIKTDVIYFLLSAFGMYNLVAVMLSFGAINVITRLFYEFTNFDLILKINNPIIQFTILFFVLDLKKYVGHYLFHKYTFLWKLHEMHHSASEFSVLTRHRGHFFEEALKRFLDVIPFAILGAPVETYIVVSVFAEVHQLLIHSGLNSHWGFIGKYLLVSPANHRVHHSIKRKHYGKNFGGTLIVWDRIFGTYLPPEKITEIGTTEQDYNSKGFIHDNILGLKLFYKELFKMFKKD